MITEKIYGDKMVFMYTSCTDKAEARHLGFSAVEEKLAICADFWPMESIYPWQGVVQDVAQYMVVFTTKKSLSRKLADFIGGLHSYRVPMIAEFDTAFLNNSYVMWADKTLLSDEDYISEHDAHKREINDEEDGYHPGKLK